MANKKKTRVKNGKKQPTAKERAIKYMKNGGASTAAAEARYKKEYRTFSARVRNFNKITGGTASAAELFLKYLKYGTRDDTVREILKIPTTNPKVSKAEAGGDLERYARKTLDVASVATANAWLKSFTLSLQTAGKGSRLRGIWWSFTSRVLVEPLEELLKKAATEEKAEKIEAELEKAEKTVSDFWAEFDRIPRGLVSGTLEFTKKWGITQKDVEWLSNALRKWSKDYENENKGGAGAGADRGYISPTTGS